MTTKRRVDQLRGAARAAGDATLAVTGVVEEMHHTIGSGPALLGWPLHKVTRLFSAPAYGATRAVTSMVGTGVDAALDAMRPVLDGPGIERNGLLSALNGVVGDYLERTGNALAIDMRLCVGDDAGFRTIEPQPVALATAFPEAKRRLLLLIHGSSVDETAWRRDGVDFGAALASSVGVTPVYLRYNTGRHVSANGDLLANLLEELVEAWPGHLDEVLLLGHSMGGLVARSACHTADQAGHAWRRKLRALVTLGTPHHGAPLERAGASFESLLGKSRYSAPLARLARLRSAGVTDLRYGNVIEADWYGREQFGASSDTRTPVPLPKGVNCFAIAATTARSARRWLPGDGLVPVASAFGYHRDPARRLAFGPDNQLLVYGTNHVELLANAEVGAALQQWLAPPAAAPALC